MQKYVRVILYLLVLLLAMIAVGGSEWIFHTILTTVVPESLRYETNQAILLLSMSVYWFVVVLIALGTAFGAAYCVLKLLHRFGLVGKSNTGAAIVIAICTPMCLFCSMVGHDVYSYIKFPSPKLVPNATILERYECPDSEWSVEEVEYVVELPLAITEQHYRVEMEKYCAEGWDFEETEFMCKEKVICRVAECEITRPFAREVQFFSVRLEAVSETQTKVYHIDRIGDFEDFLE